MSTAIELSGDAEILASKVARKKGLTLEQAVREAITESARKEGLLEERSKRSQEEAIQALDELSRRHVARPLLDMRSIDEIIGYDDFGIPR